MRPGRPTRRRIGLVDGIRRSDTTERRLVRGLEIPLVVVAGYGPVVLDAGVAAPTIIGLGIAFVPALLRRETATR